MKRGTTDARGRGETATPPAPSRRRWRRWRRAGRRRLQLAREGKYFLFITIAVGLAAVNTGNNLLYLVLGWLLSIIVASGVMSDASLRGLRISRRAPPRVYASLPFLMEISARNTKRWLSSFSVEVEDLAAGRPLDKKCWFLKVPPGRTQTTRYRHTFSRRGWHRLDGFRLGSRFPFSLFLKTRHQDGAEEILVLPAVVPVSQPPPRARYLGETASNRVGRNGDFFGLREYREGDDRRDVHWRSTARTGRAMVREYEQEAQKRAIVAIDNALPAGADQTQRDALEDAVSLAASLSHSYLGRGFTVQVIARGSSVPFGSGPGHAARILEYLALLPTVDDEAPFSAPVDPAVDSVLVRPRGVDNAGLPASVGSIREAGA